MGKPTGFLDYQRELPEHESVTERVKHYHEFDKEFSNKLTQKQAARCMDCGTPFCHSGCPLGNNIPEFNEEVYKGDWQGAYDILSSTNNLPEITGRICPALCEASCVLGINTPQVTIEHLEKTIIETAFKAGFVKPDSVLERTGKKIAVVGSGPAGMSAAMQLNKAGHWVTVFERDDRVGGLMRYGIPDFKLEKVVIDRRVKVMETSGIVFKTNTIVGVDVKVEELKNNFDYVLLTGGSTIARDINIPGRNLKGIHFAMDFLKQQNKEVAGDMIADKISANRKNIVVIGGGDTGSDCVGTSNRHGAKSILQVELLDKPTFSRADDNPWPQWWKILKTTSSHEEGCERLWNILTKEFIGDSNGNLKGIKIADIKWEMANGQMTYNEVEGSIREVPCELALLAVGFLHPQYEGLLKDLQLELDERGNVKTNYYKTSVDNIFAAGDMRRGQSLVVWAISEGRAAAKAIDEAIRGFSILESTDNSIIGVDNL